MEYSKEAFDRLVEKNKQLKIENDSMKKILSSKRFMAAEKIANSYNAVFPEGTKRRKVVKLGIKPAIKIMQSKSRRLTKKLNRICKDRKKVVVIHSIVWNAPLKQRPHHLAKCLAEANRDVMIVYFEPDEQLKTFRKINDNLVTTNSWEAIFGLNTDGNKYFFFNNVSNMPFELVEKISGAGYKIVYEYIDEFHEDVAGSLVNQLETWDRLPKMKPCLVLASANKLFKEAKEHFKDTKVILSRNAVNVEDFDYRRYISGEAPSDLAKILKDGKPIVGYYGALAHWLDYDLISYLARKNRNLNVVLLGVNYQNALGKLDQSINNIYYLGPKKYDELALYSSHFNCAIIPFKTGQIAKGTSPVKLFEYMAMGLPTIGTRDLDECKGYEYVYLAKDKDDFSELIKKAIKEHGDEKVRARLLEEANDNSWYSRAVDIIENL